MSEDHRSNVIPFSRKPAGKVDPVTSNRTAVTSPKMPENNGLGGVCHRSKNVDPVIVTVTEKRKPGKQGKVSAYEASVSDDQWRHDIATMTRGQLQKAYPGTYTCFKDMKYDRAKPVEDGGEGAIIDPNVSDLAKFMIALGGPRRHPDMTVDRIDPNDPTYAFGKIRWRDKRGQANNRSSNSHVRNPLTKGIGTVAEVAAQVGLKANTITVALNRAIAKNPTDEANIRTYIVGDLLLRAGKDAGDAAGEQSAAAQVINMPDYGMADDPAMRWPWPLNKGQRQALEKLYQHDKPMEQVPRRVEMNHAPFYYYERPWRPVSRYDFAMRVCERKRRQALDTVADIEHHAREYILSPTDEAELAEAKATVTRMDDYLAAALRGRPGFLDELAEHEAIHSRALAPWEVTERERAAKVRAEMEHETYSDDYVDEEDAERKRAERGEW
jgi:hypothetical protein